MKSKYFEPLAVLVAGGNSIKAASETAGCALQTAYNISATTEFRQRVAALRTEVTVEAIGKLTTATTKAVDTLVELLSSENEASVRLNASKAILAALGPLSDHGELRARIDALEGRAPGLKVAQ